MSHSPFENLRIWQEGMAIAKWVYEHTRQFPKEEQYGLVSQMRRCAVSIPSNIAEGSQRGSDKEFAHFILIARGSWAELKTQLLLARDLQFLSTSSAEELLVMLQQVGKQLGSFHVTLTKKSQ